jgi:hypothetical protein
MDIRVRRPRSVFVVSLGYIAESLFTAIPFFCATPFTCFLTQQYGRSVNMVFWLFFTCATTCVTTGTAAQHTADSTGCDEVNSEHVPRPAGGGRVALERAAAAYCMRQGVNSLQTPQGNIRGHLPARFGVLLTCCSLTCWCGGPPQNPGAGTAAEHTSSRFVKVLAEAP